MNVTQRSIRRAAGSARTRRTYHGRLGFGAPITKKRARRPASDDLLGRKKKLELPLERLDPSHDPEQDLIRRDRRILLAEDGTVPRAEPTQIGGIGDHGDAFGGNPIIDELVAIGVPDRDERGGACQAKATNPSASQRAANVHDGGDPEDCRDGVQVGRHRDVTVDDVRRMGSCERDQTVACSPPREPELVPPAQCLTATPDRISDHEGPNSGVDKHVVKVAAGGRDDDGLVSGSLQPLDQVPVLHLSATLQVSAGREEKNTSSVTHRETAFPPALRGSRWATSGSEIPDQRPR